MPIRPDGLDDDQTIDDDDRCYRRITPLSAERNENRDGKVWPTSACFQPSDDDGTVSVFLESIMNAIGCTPKDVLEGRESDGLCVFPVRAAREAGFGVIRAPEEEPPRVNSAHAGLTGYPLGSKVNRTRARNLTRCQELDVIKDPAPPDTASADD
jgi:hypothetical protein